MDIIKISDLSKKFNGLAAVDNANFTVKEGEVLAFLGPNGAGKTTTISMLATILEPTSGTAEINGFDIIKNKSDVRKSIGVIFQDPSLDDELTACENLIFHGVMYDIKKELMEDRISELLKLVDLLERKDDLVKTFSGGMKRRLEIARGLMHHPKVLFLDEPTVGLDPQTRNHILEYIKKLNEIEHITIILTTHYMEEADKLCDRIAIIDHGKIIALDTSDSLKSLMGGDVVSLQCSEPQKLSNILKKEKWINKLKLNNNILDISVAKVEEKLVKLLEIAGKANVKINSLSLRSPTLEDVFLHLTGKSIREEEASGKDSMRLARRMWRR